MKIHKRLNRFYVRHMDEAIAFYEKLLGSSCSLRFRYAEAGLELAQIEDILVLAGSEEALQPFRETKATFLVDSVSEYRAHLLACGASVIRDIQTVPTGSNMTLKHPDGTVVEYVEFTR